MAFHVEEVVDIHTVGDLIAALEEFPDELPVRVGDADRLRIRIVPPRSEEKAGRRREFIQIEGDHDEG